MKTQIRIQGDTIIVSIDGHLSYEASDPFREKLKEIVQSSSDANPTSKKIIFDLSNLEFVGSSGISTFIQTLKSFNSQATKKPVFCHVSTEFQKIMKAFDEADDFEFYDDLENAKSSLDQ